MDVEKYSAKWLLNEIRKADTDAHALFKIMDFQKALTEQCNIANVSQQRELLRSYNKFVNEKCLLAGGILSDFEIEKFEERNGG